MTTPKEVFTYRRVSTDEQAQNFSLPTQRSACLRYAEDNSWVVRREFMDDGWSGENVDRPALEEMRYLLKDCDIHAVIIYDVDRLSRRLIDLLTLDEEFRRRGVELIFAQYPTDPSPEGFLFLQMRGAFAEYERHKIAERFHRGKIGRALAGVPGWGILPYGYQYVSDGRWKARWEIDPLQASVVRDMFHWLVEDGLSVRSITKKLNSKGIKPKRGKGWGKTSVHRVLTNQGYTGTAYWNKTMKIEPKTHKVPRPSRKRSKAVQRDRSEWIPIQVPEIVPGELFSRAQARLDANRNASAPSKSRDYLLTGHVYCICGSRMSGSASHDRRFYRCVRKDPVLIQPCTSGLLNAEKAEVIVWNRIMEVLQEPEKVIPELDRHHSRRQDARNRKSFELDVKRTVWGDIDRKRRQWENAYEADAIDLVDFKEKVSSLRQQEKDIGEDIADLERRINIEETKDGDILSLKAALSRINEKLSNADFQRRRWVLDTLQIRVSVGKDGSIETTGLITIGGGVASEQGGRQEQAVPVTSL